MAKKNRALFQTNKEKLEFILPIAKEEKRQVNPEDNIVDNSIEDSRNNSINDPLESIDKPVHKIKDIIRGNTRNNKFEPINNLKPTSQINFHIYTELYENFKILLNLLGNKKQGDFITELIEAKVRENADSIRKYKQFINDLKA